MYPLAPDLLLKEGYGKVRKKKGEPEWECHFSPAQYLENHPNPDLEKMRLSQDRLRRYGEQVTRIRGWILERASLVDIGPKMEMGKLLQEISSVEKKKWQRESKKQEEANPLHYLELINPIPPGLRKRGTKRSTLTVE